MTRSVRQRAPAALAASVRRRCRFTLPGLWVALVFACLSFTPSLLPRPASYQGLVAGVDAAIGYGLGVAGAWVWREFADRAARTPSRRQWWVLAVVAGAGLVVSLVLSIRWQRQTAALVQMRADNGWALVVTPVVGVLVFVVVLALARTLRAAYRWLAALFARHIGARAARASAVVAMVVALVLLTSGVLWNAVVGSLDSSLAAGDLLTPSDVHRPTTMLRSGGPGSLVPWDSLGQQGRIFVGRGPDAADISELGGTDAEEPIRVYAGTASASDTEERARLAVADLDRAGGFERSSLLVVTTTGTGWVEPSAASAFEYLTGGDSAVVAMQYSHLPSVLSYLVDQTKAREAGRDLFDAVYEHWAALPTDDRPQLYVFGESLGSFGGESAFSGEFDLANRTDGTMFVGPPSFNPLYRGFVDQRDPGSREVVPVYREGRTVRFSNRPRSGIPPEGRSWPNSRVLYLQHASDPITWWSPHLLLHRPDWLRERRGDDVSPSMRWFPVVTFWQVSADLALGFSTPPGHGHNYSGEHVDGWRAVLRPSGWDDAKIDELRARLRRP